MIERGGHGWKNAKTNQPCGGRALQKSNLWCSRACSTVFFLINRVKQEQHRKRFCIPVFFSSCLSASNVVVVLYGGGGCFRDPASCVYFNFNYISSVCMCVCVRLPPPLRLFSPLIFGLDHFVPKFSLTFRLAVSSTGQANTMGNNMLSECFFAPSGTPTSFPPPIPYMS